jgi:hypothetical protein
MAVALEPIIGPLVPTAWRFAEPWVHRACEEGALVETPASYKERCVEESAQLWLIRDGLQIVGACITEVYETPKGLTCAVPVVASESFEHIEPLFAFVEEWARSEGCVRMEGYGRFGWVRALKQFGWRPLAAVIEKDI